MALVVKREYYEFGCRETVRLGAIERAKRTNIRYAIDFYRRAGLKNLLKDLEVDFWQFTFIITGNRKDIEKPDKIQLKATLLNRKD